MSTLTFDEVESCFPETELIVIDGFGKDIVSAQWLHDFAHKVEQLVLAKADHEFKNFHRALCERFNYAHDPIDWKRDQVSLIEHIAKSNNDMIEGQRDVITDLENRLERLQEELATALTDKFDHHAEARQSALAAHGLTESDLQSPAPVSEAPSQPLTRTVEQLIEATEKSANFIPEFSGFEVRSLIGNMKGLQAQLDRSQHTLSAPPHSEQQEPDELHDIGCECGWTGKIEEVTIRYPLGNPVPHRYCPKCGAICTIAFATIPYEPAPQPSQEKVLDIPWQTMASAWLKGKAAEQAQANEKYPRHAECYPTWVARVGILQKLAADIEHDLQSQPKQSTGSEG